ncbi:MAG: helix-turn-helix domain-containing protein, partial [Caulobacterales bacterium]|nr:helix-turn-helix domain-containing protein [Caulobacterales bacterium]
EEHGAETSEGEAVGFKMSQGDLGAYVSLSRENVNRQLKEWEADRIIALHQGRVRVIDRDTLEDIAAFDE